MKAKSICAFVENKKGDFWQIALDENQQAMVMDLIGQMHDGTVKVLKNKLPLYYEKNKEENPQFEY